MSPLYRYQESFMARKFGTDYKMFDLARPPTSTKVDNSKSRKSDSPKKVDSKPSTAKSKKGKVTPVVTEEVHEVSQ